MEFVCRVADLEDRIARDLGRVVGRVIRCEKMNQVVSSVKEDISERKTKPASQEELKKETTSEPETEVSETRSSHDVEQDPECWARANVDFVPSPYDDSSLSFKCGQMIKVVERRDTGLWVGECNGRRGKFKFVNVTVLERYQPTKIFPAEHLTTPLPDFLSQIGLSSLSSRLLLHGFDTVLSLLDLEPHSLQLLGITDNAETEKLLFTAKIIASIFAGGCEWYKVVPELLKTISTPGYTQNCEIEGDTKQCRDEKPVVVVDYKTQFEKTLKKFDDKPRLRLIPTCGFKQRIM